MKPAIADFIIHVNESLSEPDMLRVADTVCADACVTSACVSHDDPHSIVNKTFLSFIFNGLFSC